jgi:hypothetical protein
MAPQLLAVAPRHGKPQPAAGEETVVEGVGHVTGSKRRSARPRKMRAQSMSSVIVVSSGAE